MSMLGIANCEIFLRGSFAQSVENIVFYVGAVARLLQ
jgi:hypothetical protein